MSVYNGGSNAPVDEGADNNEDVDSEQSLKQRQNKEKKELQAKITNMKHSVSKSDRAKKKEIANEIARLEENLTAKHQRELQELRCRAESIDNKKETIEVTEDPVIGNVSAEPDCEEEGENVQRLDKTEGRITKAQKRRNKKEAKAKETERIIAVSAEQAKSGVRYKEYEAFTKVLAARSLSFHPVPADGDCLYNAVAHQLSLCGLSAQVDELRRQVASDMRNNEDDYLPFLTNHDGEPLSGEQFVEYCDKLLKPGVWGGHPELVALSTHLRRPIEVLQANASPIVIGEQYADHAKPLIITYHRHAFLLGEHYNSTTPQALASKEPNDDDEDVKDF